MNHARLTTLLVPFGFALLLPLACSKKPPPPVVPAAPVAEAGADADTDAAPLAAFDAAVMMPMDAGMAMTPEAGALVPPDVGASEAVLTLALDKLGKTAAPGMTVEGEQGRTTLQEGGHFPMLITLQPNRCYTIVATSPPGNVTKLDLKLLAPPFFNVAAGQSGAKDGASPVIGRGKAHLCPFLPLPIAYKLDVAATKGSGPVGVRVYAKNK